MRRIGKAGENQLAAGFDLQRGEPFANLAGFATEQSNTLGDADGLAAHIEAPMMETTDDRAIAFLGIAQGIKSMGAFVLKGNNTVLIALDED